MYAQPHTSVVLDHRGAFCVVAIDGQSRSATQLSFARPFGASSVPARHVENQEEVSLEASRTRSAEPKSPPRQSRPRNRSKSSRAGELWARDPQLRAAKAWRTRELNWNRSQPGQTRARGLTPRPHLSFMLKMRSTTELDPRREKDSSAPGHRARLRSATPATGPRSFKRM